MIETHEGTYGVEDILLGFEPKDVGSIPARSVDFFSGCTLKGNPKEVFMLFFQNGKEGMIR